MSTPFTFPALGIATRSDWWAMSFEDLEQC
jgi:hypothetical protein